MSDTITVTASDVSDLVTVTASDVSDMVTVAVTTADDQVTVEVSNDQGPQGIQGIQGPQGDQGPQGENYDPATSFIGLLFGGAAGAEVPVVSPAAGIRITHTYAGPITRYRFIADDDSADDFYSDAALTSLIASRYF